MTITLSKTKLAIAVLAVALVVPATALATHVFDDVDDGRFYAEPIEWAADNGITTGVSSNPPLFAPERNVTRGENVTFLKRYDDNIVQPAVNALQDDVDDVQADIDAAEADIATNTADIASLPVGPTAGALEASGSCLNDNTGPGEGQDGVFLPCTDAVALGAQESHSVLLTAHIGWISFGGPADGLCQLQKDGVEVPNSTIPMGELTDNTSGNAKSYASVTVITEASTGTADYTVGCHENTGDMDWSEITISGVVVAPVTVTAGLAPDSGAATAKVE